MLNALRHHGGGHRRVSVDTTNLSQCSTPYGITAEVTTARKTLGDSCSWCSTPYGITAEVTGWGREGTGTCSCAQRLTASRRRSPVSPSVREVMTS